MDITVSHEQGRVPITVFHLKGKLDVTTYAELEKKVQASYEAGMRNLILDLSEVPYISSAGLQALHRIFLRLRSDAPSESDEMMRKGIRDGTYKSAHLKLLKPSAKVLEVLKTVGYDMYMDVHSNLKDAVAAF